jgi:putative heme iron utilization protein
MLGDPVLFCPVELSLASRTDVFATIRRDGANGSPSRRRLFDFSRFRVYRRLVRRLPLAMDVAENREADRFLVSPSTIHSLCFTASAAQEMNAIKLQKRYPQFTQEEVMGLVNQFK